MKKYLKIEELSVDCLLKLNILIEEIRYNSSLNKQKNWYRFRFSNPITIYELKKLFFLAEKFGYILTESKIIEELKTDHVFKLKKVWTCQYLKSLESHLLPQEKYQRQLLPTNKKELKLKLVNDCFNQHPHFNIKEIANHLKISERTAHIYFNLLKINNPNIKKVPKVKEKPIPYYKKTAQFLNEAAWLLNDLDINDQIKDPEFRKRVQEFRNKHLKI